MADNAEVVEQTLEQTLHVVSEVLELVIQNRNKRKAKDIVVVCLEFILAVGAVVASIESEIKALNDADDVECDTGGKCYEGDFFVASITYIIAALTILYAVVVSVATFRHAYQLPTHLRTLKAVEEAYAETNSVPLFDGFLEIGISLRLGGGCGYVTGVWTFFGVTVIALICSLAVGVSSVGICFAITLAVVQLYRITADLCEYRVHTRLANMNRVDMGV